MMKVIVSFKEQNPDYNKEYADTYHCGLESENNWKLNWQTALTIEGEIKETLIKDDTDFILKGSYKDSGEKFEFSIPNMKEFRVIFKNGNTSSFAVSKSLLKSTYHNKNEKYNTSQYYFYFKPESDFIMPLDGLYIDTNDIPKELLEDTDSRK
jgi:hypothetical protein